MDLNATLIGQMITFAVFVLFTMKYVWPPITKAMQAREKKIADGLAASQRGHLDLELAKKEAVKVLNEAGLQANQIIDQAKAQGNSLIEEAKENALRQVEIVTKQGQAEVARQYSEAKLQLKNQVSALAIEIAQKVVQNELNQSSHQTLVDKMISELYRSAEEV